jgi:hypothetical protein
VNQDRAAVLAPEKLIPDLLTFEATDVTGSHTVVAKDVQPSLPAGAVANALANQMSLPADVPWALRDDKTSAFLDDSLAIGDQIETDAKLVLTTKAHLG